MGEDWDEKAHRELEWTRDALSDARVLLDGDGTRSVVISRPHLAGPSRDADL